MALPPMVLAADVTPAEVAKACGADAGSACRWTLERTGSVATAKVVDWFFDVPVKVLVILAVSWIAAWLLRRAIKRLGERIGGISVAGEVNVRAAARAETITSVLRSLTSVVIGTFAFIYVLDALGWSIGPLIAGAGLAGIALGFGAQSLVRDFLAGLFLLLEDQYGVGDVVDLGEATGTVEKVTLRATRLRDANGTVWHVPNGVVQRVGNKSQQWARAVLDVPVAPTADLERAAEVIGAAARAVWASEEAAPDVLAEPEVLGLEYLGPDAATIRVQGKTRPGAQWRVSRQLRVKVAEALAEAEIALPPSSFVRPGGGTSTR
ncbi:MAG: mechanosensitive ion channel family protein [Acidimicrobiales bacterium]